MAVSACEEDKGAFAINLETTIGGWWSLYVVPSDCMPNYAQLTLPYPPTQVIEYHSVALTLLFLAFNFVS